MAVVPEKSENAVWHNVTVTRARRERLNGHRSVAVWFTGLSGAGKSTIAHTVEEMLHQRGCLSYTFDGDNVRHGLCADLGFSAEDRHENLRRIGEMVKLFLDAGVIALTAFISPMRADRDRLRQLIGPDNFIEVYCACPVEVCEHRDVKGLYRKARAGEIKDFTGISAPYEPPQHPDLLLPTHELPLDECARQVLAAIAARGVFDRSKL